MRILTVIEIMIFGIASEVRYIDSYSNPKYNWPLGDSSYAFETVEGLSPSSDNSQCGFYFAGSNPSLPEYFPLSLNGYDYPYVDITFSDSNTFQDFSFSFYVKPSSITGCLLHYKDDTPSSSNVNEFRLSVQNSVIELLFRGTSFEDALTVPNTMTINTWHFVSFARHYSSGKVELNIGNVQVFNQDNSFMNSKILSIPGTIRVGSSFDATVGHASGHYMCLQFYDGIFSRSDQSDATDRCKMGNWDKSPSGLPAGPGPGCPVPTTIIPTTGHSTTLTTTDLVTEAVLQTSTITAAKTNTFSSYFELIAKDKKLMYFDISTIKTTTFLTCARKCSSLHNCLALAVEPIAYRHNNCTMYSGVDPSYLFNSMGAVLYKKRLLF